MQLTLLAATALLLQLHGVAAFAPRVVPLPAGYAAWRARPCARTLPLHMISWASWGAAGGERGTEEKREELKKSLRRLVAQTKQGKGSNDAERVPSPGASTARRTRTTAGRCRSLCM
jgi:hypothetical protein